MKKTRLFALALAVVMIFSALSVSAFAAYAPASNADMKTAIQNKGGTILQIEDFAAGTNHGAAAVVDGNNSATNTFFQLYDGENGALKTQVGSGNGNSVITAPNVQRNYVDGANGKALRFYTYAGTKYQMIINGTTVNQGDDFWVTVDGGVYTVVPEGTAGAIKAKAVKSDDNNNCIQKYRSNDQAASILDNVFVVSLNFRYAGDVDVIKLIAPTFHGSAPAAAAGEAAVALRASDDALLGPKGEVLAILDTTRYYDLTAVMSTKQTGTDTYSWVTDIYLDGHLVYSGAFLAAYANKTLAEFQQNATSGTWKLRYHFIAKYNKANSGVETPLDVLYVKNVQDYYIPANVYTYDNYVNSGDTIEGYDLTLGANLELNYYMNLIPDVVADANAKVTFKIGEEVVAEKKVSEVSAGAKGLYMFTCPVNSTQMASDIKVSIESETREYKIYMDGVATDDYSYSVAEYANTLLADTGSSAELKAVVKAMLNYGAYAQTYFAAKNGTTVDKLANVGCEYTEAELNAANFGTGTVTGATAGMTATLVLDTDTVIKIYKDDVLVAESAGITADKLDEDVTVGGVTVSVLTLAGKVPAEKTNFKNLAKALALYSAATEAYILA